VIDRQETVAVDTTGDGTFDTVESTEVEVDFGPDGEIDEIIVTDTVVTVDDDD